jgi:glycerol-3-phosphate dehydrogenase (NAD(P)+)
MVSKSTSKPVGVVGAGSFGTAIANLLSENCKEVILYARTPERAAQIQKDRKSGGQVLAQNIRVTNDLASVGKECDVLFPVVPSANFREMMQNLSQYLRPYHILIHGTKGFDLDLPKRAKKSPTPIDREWVYTMSQVIRQESTVVRVGCMAGPNLSREIGEHKPAATVIASPFNEVVLVGQKLLKSDRFLVYGSHDLLGTELCGILKNIIAVGAGIISGLNLGENAKALFISRGLVEMIYLGKALGANVEPFLGLAGVGDLIATCSTSLSRNFTVGYRLAQGETMDQILATMEEVAEGVKTIDLIFDLSKQLGIRCVINEMLYKIIHQQMSVQNAHTILMKMPFQQEVDFLNRAPHANI